MPRLLKRILISAAVLAVIGAAGIWWALRPDVALLSADAGTGKVPDLGAPRYQNVPTMRVADAVGWAAGAQPKAAAGLKVQAFAEGLEHPRWLYRLPNGDILVAETNSPPRDVGGITGLVMGWLMGKAGAGVPSPNRITLLRDSNGDGVAETRSAFLTGLNSPFGMTLMGGWLYVANTDGLVRFPYKEGDTRIAAKPEKVVSYAGGGNHWTRDVVAAPDGKSLFVSVGSSSNIGENGLDKEGSAIYEGDALALARNPKAAEQGRALILEIFPDSKTMRVLAWGLRNPVGLAFEPVSQRLWTVVNERDMMGSDSPPDYLTRVEFGGFYGWPWNYWGGYEDPRVSPGRPDLREYSRRPDFGLGPHVAPLGLTFASGARLGPNWSNGAFIGLHGSWNREPLSGYKVVYVPFGDNGLPAKDAKPVDVLTGFLDAGGKKAQGRPVGVIVDASGGLLVADDVGNRIWRVSSAQTPVPEPAPGPKPAPSPSPTPKAAKGK
ncbi:PQQ-dependent sugar dehydrogenase [Sphingomonas canadensis]|uniref:PQQ-dependent sugar dehydrogenase n=1 Tax=Sphingomonas canadensis TaxID=1219257 RepID=A0ABW3HC45_9SPHN|nr:sorbosone dehydrogenase family protein [Sphingomonas canadensis]MCW3838389.1 sorbosone dehydrogenase family protein [Sphingomonas canadensis]